MPISLKHSLPLYVLIILAGTTSRINALEEKSADDVGRKGDYKLEAPGVSTRG